MMRWCSIAELIADCAGAQDIILLYGWQNTKKKIPGGVPNHPSTYVGNGIAYQAVWHGSSSASGHPIGDECTILHGAEFTFFAQRE